MSDSVWRAGRGMLRRWLERRLPAGDWTREFLDELDHELARRARSGTGVRLTLWYLRQLLSPSTLGFVRAVRARRRRELGAPRSAGWSAGLALDLRLAWRGLRSEPTATLLVVSTLAVGIGSFAAMQGMAQRLFLAGPPHVETPDRLVRVYLAFDDTGGTRISPWIPHATARAVRDGVAAFEGATIYRRTEELAGFGGRARPVAVSEVDEHYFATLGTAPGVGRLFVPGEATSLVIGAALALEQFGSPAAALGSEVRLGERSATVVGVMPPGFAGPDLERVDLWIPMDRDRADTTNWWTLGRLADGRGRALALAEAEAIHARVDPGASFQWARRGRLALSTVDDDLSGRRSTETSIAGLLLAVVTLMLAISWVNVLNLLLARVTRRRTEVLVRLALGIGRWRLARYLLVESLLLSALAGLSSLPIAYGEGVLVRDVLLPGVAWGSELLDLGTLTVTAATVVASALLLGMLPARQAGRADLAGGLAAVQQGPGARQAQMQSVLAAAQVTLSAALLLCAGLFVKSFWTMRVTDLGVDATQVHMVQLRSLDFDFGGGAEAEEALYERAFASLRQVGPADRAALTVGLPFFTNFGMSLHLDDRDSIPELPGGGPFISLVSAGYFETIGTPIVRGVAIDAEDVETGARVAVLGAATAEALWPDEEPLGRCVRVGGPEAPCYRVVGIARDVHRVGYREPDSMQVYLPYGVTRNFRGSTLLVRSSARPATLETEISRAVPEVDYIEMRRIDSLLDAQIRPWKLGAAVLSLVASLAIAVSLAGVFGVLSYLVAQRRREIGVRMALGASRASIRGRVVRSGLITSLAGLALGFGIVFAAAPWIEGLLFETAVADPLVLGLVSLALVAAALLACLLPAGQAARVDPVSSLRAGAS